VQTGDEAGLVADGEVEVDEVDVDLEGLGVVLVDGLSGGVAGGRRAAGFGRLLGAKGWRQSEAQGGSNEEETHGSLDAESVSDVWEKRLPCAGSGHFVTRIPLRLVLPMVAGWDPAMSMGSQRGVG